MGDCEFRLKIRQIGVRGIIAIADPASGGGVAARWWRVTAGLSGTVAVRSANLLLFFAAPERERFAQSGQKPPENWLDDGWHGTCISEQRT